jgi:hypothetical protein
VQHCSVFLQHTHPEVPEQQQFSLSSSHFVFLSSQNSLTHLPAVFPHFKSLLQHHLSVAPLVQHCSGFLQQTQLDLSGQQQLSIFSSHFVLVSAQTVFATQ